MSASNYPPGVTGNEPEINGDAGWEALHENIDKDATREGWTDVDAQVAWWLGVEAFKATKKLGAQFHHDRE